MSETGESFPDVGLLEPLSELLPVSVEELVIGEETAHAQDDPLKELLHLMKLQNKERSRKLVAGLIAASLLIDLLVWGVGTLVGSFIRDWPDTVYFVSLIVMCLFAAVYLTSDWGSCRFWGEMPV